MPAMNPNTHLLKPTALLDFEHPAIQALVTERGWRSLPESERIGAVYDYVRNDVAFGYNEGDELSASRVLADGIGQCNTKGTLLMALLRAVGIPCRYHGFTIDKALQRGAVTGVAYWLAPPRIIHSWVEVQHEGRWLALEGFILDAPYLSSLQRRFAARQRFFGYGAATPDLQRPGVEWTGAPTYIQKEGIVDDFGIFEDPDSFFMRHGSNLSGVKRWLFVSWIRHAMNRNVERVRAGEWMRSAEAYCS
jgi:transglutaminase-like putative cysteine protease